VRDINPALHISFAWRYAGGGEARPDSALRPSSFLPTTPTMSGAPADILLRNLLARMRADVDTLLTLHHLSPDDAAAILGKLPAAPGELELPAPQRGPPPPPRTPRPGVNARALWAYNERREGADLSFAVGDTVEVLDRTNAEWWTGRAHGREGASGARWRWASAR
jgi:hypothetical protein